MKFDRKGGGWKFSSGRTRYAHSQKLGISWDKKCGWDITYGYDGCFWSQYEWEYPPEEGRYLAREDLAELADHQIARWQEFRKWLSEPQEPVK